MLEVQTHTVPMKKASLMWALLAFFSFFQFFIQTSGNLMGAAWQADFHLNEISLSLLSSSFFYAYVIVQILAGFLYDYWGVRRVVCVTVFIFAAGLLLFALTHSFPLAIVARFLMGCGAGFAFVGMVYVAATWFPVNLFIVFVGLGELLSMLLTATGQWLAADWVLHYGWRAVILGLSFLGFALFIMVLAFLKDHPSFKPCKQDSFFFSFGKAFKQASKIKAVWLAGLYGAGLFSVITVFASLWGGFFLKDALHYSYLEASYLIGFIPFGIAFGGPFFGFINDRYIKTTHLIKLTSFALLIISIAVLFAEGSLFQETLLLGLLGFVGGANVLAFYLVEKNVEPSIRGISVGFCNALVILVGTLVQSLVGVMFKVCDVEHAAQTLAAKWAMLPFCGVILIAFIAACLFRRA